MVDIFRKIRGRLTDLVTQITPAIDLFNAVVQVQAFAEKDVRFLTV